MLDLCMCLTQEGHRANIISKMVWPFPPAMCSSGTAKGKRGPLAMISAGMEVQRITTCASHTTFSPTQFWFLKGGAAKRVPVVNLHQP